MVLVADELKRKRAELGEQIEGLRSQIAALEQQQTAFDLVIRTYEPDYMPDASGTLRRSKRAAPSPNSITQLFKGFDRRSFVLRTLRKAESPMSTADFARVFATETGLPEDDARLGQIGSRFSQVLDQLAKANRIRRAGMIDGRRYQWEVAA
jgi:hypothetical protein